MKIVDIVNRDIATLENCDHEPIHIPGSIQPHGFLLGINSGSWTIDYCSANLGDYVSEPFQQVIGARFSEIFGPEKEQLIHRYIEQTESMSIAPMEMDFDGKEFQLNIHRSGNIYVVEAEVQPQVKESLTDMYAQTFQFVSYMNSTHTLKELCDLVADGTRKITGYDRVMIYKFDADYNGEVFAESRRENIEPFLGLHYPHTDIPAQARELYLRNLMRLIVDVSYKPVPIYTIDDAPGKNLDLSLSLLRSTSPIHVEYLQNIGVQATLTISLIHQGRLWGLIACHHYSPKNIPRDIRLAVQLQGQFITSQIDVRQSNEEYEVARRTNMALEKLTGLNLPAVTESFKIISLIPELLKVCNASGVSLLISGEIYKNGLTPSDEDIRALSHNFAMQSNDTMLFTNRLADVSADVATRCEMFSGAIYHSLGSGNSIIWYRPETITEVNWAGDPAKAVIRDSDGLHPRKSFSRWKQIVKCQSSPWIQPELNAAANYAHALQRQITLILLTQEEERYKKLNEVLVETNSELENINWISNHNLQEPLRKIQMFASKYLDGYEIPTATTGTDVIEKINNSAQHMQRLLKDILEYSRLKQSDQQFEQVDLQNILDDVMAELNDMLQESEANIRRQELPKVMGIPFLLKQLFYNILTNSLKFASPHRKLQIDITVEENHKNQEYFHMITFSDNGIGFEQKYADSIFNVFTKLKGGSSENGTGVGLALCKKIMQMNNGRISANAAPDAGTSITLYFPVIRI